MLCYAENEKPTMKDINRYTMKFADCWKGIALELELEPSVIKAIKNNHQHDCKACLQAVIEKWLMLNSNATWKTLEVALTNVNRLNLGLDPVDDISGM